MRGNRVSETCLDARDLERAGSARVARAHQASCHHHHCDDPCCSSFGVASERVRVEVCATPGDACRPNPVDLASIHRPIPSTISGLVRVIAPMSCCNSRCSSYEGIKVG